MRRAVAHIGLIDPQLIHALDRYPEELDVLPLWDSMDWLPLILEMEYQSGWEISRSMNDWALQPSFSVKDLVHAVVERRPR